MMIHLARMNRRRLVSVALAVAAGLSAAADRGARNGKVSFKAVGPAGFKMVGTTNQISVTEEGGTIRVTVPLATLKTGIDLRDAHMREKTLETRLFPEATLAVPRSVLKLPAADGQQVKERAHGTFTLHGVSREQPFDYSIRREGGRLRVTGELKLDIRNHGMSVASYVGITVKPEIEVQVELDANP